MVANGSATGAAAVPSYLLTGKVALVTGSGTFHICTLDTHCPVPDFWLP